MGTIAENLQSILNSKEAIRTSINNKGVTVTTSDTLASYAGYIDEIITGGGTPITGYTVRFIDFDGTILKEEIVASGSDATAPTPPTHEYLTFNSWNNSYINITNDKDIGAIYDTTDEKTYLFITIVSSGNTTFTQYINLNKSTTSTMTIDWGDTTTTTDSTSGNRSFNHIYSASGNYIITLTDSGLYNIGQSDFSYPFMNRSNQTLNKIYLGKKVNSITNYGFFEQKNLQYVSLNKEITNLNSQTFSTCYKIKNIIIPSGLTTIGTEGFLNCYSLKSVVLPSSITTLNANSFSTCYSLKDIIIPPNVTSIGNSSFYNCNTLQKIIITSSSITFGTSVFRLCYNIRNINFSTGSTSIGTYMCNLVYALENLILPSTITSIGTYAFQNCHSLKSINIPSGVTLIDSSAFETCYGLNEIIINSSTPATITTTSFNLLPKSCIIYVPDSNVNDYKTATNWSIYANYIHSINER